ncbi:hypothetical protein QP448_12990, partial [Staphylococcus haemolyticus]
NVAVADAQRSPDSDVVAVTVSALVESGGSDAADEGETAAPKSGPASSAAASPSAPGAQAEQTAQEAERDADGPRLGEGSQFEVRYWQV